MLNFAAGHIREAGLSGRVSPLLADVQSLPFADNSVDLFVSRGSIFFWEDRPGVFSGVYRALAPGGAAYLGGSFGTIALRQEIFARMREENPHWDRDVARRGASAPPEDLLRDLRAAGVPSSGIKKEETGFWVEIKKSRL
jgi:ubiquinone/menaquinone biosynthesis C-methylase UbiE